MRVLVIGAGGRLGRAVLRAAHAGVDAGAPAAGLGLEVLAWTRADWDLSEPDDGGLVTVLAQRLLALRVNAVIVCAALSDVDRAEREPALAEQVNHLAVAALAQACAAQGVALIHVSTDYVFGGDRVVTGRDAQALGVAERPSPVNQYGASKLRGERAVALHAPNALIARVSWLHGAGEAGFVVQILAQAQAGQAVAIGLQQVSVPTPLSWLAQDLLRAAVLKVQEHELGSSDRALHGVVHLVPQGMASRSQWAEQVLACACEIGLIAQAVPIVVVPQPTHLPAPRPKFTPMQASTELAWSRTTQASWQAGIADTIRAWPRNL